MLRFGVAAGEVMTPRQCSCAVCVGTTTCDPACNSQKSCNPTFVREGESYRSHEKPDLPVGTTTPRPVVDAALDQERDTRDHRIANTVYPAGYGDGQNWEDTGVRVTWGIPEPPIS